MHRAAHGARHDEVGDRQLPAVDVVVTSGGGPVDRGVLLAVGGLPSEATVIAADGGAALARELGLRVDLLVGDLDSVTAGAVERVVDAGGQVEAHPAAKDATDLELALVRAGALGARHVLALGGDGGRLDHLLAGALTLAGEATRGYEVTAVLGRALVLPVRAGGGRLLPVAQGATLSIVPVGGPATVGTTGLRYPLRDEVLEPGTTRGVSNVVDGLRAEVAVAEGTVLVVVPHADGDVPPAEPTPGDTHP